MTCDGATSSRSTKPWRSAYCSLWVIATKAERNARRGCDYVTRHPGLGKRLCLVREEFLTFPDQAPVVISIRRNALAYKVYEQRVVLPGSARA